MFRSHKEYEEFLRNNVMSTKQAAEYLGITRGGISFLVKEGKITPFYDRDHVRLFSRREIERYKRERDGF